MEKKTSKTASPSHLVTKRPLESPGKRVPDKNVVKAMIFDLDGTVINSIESDYMAWQKAFREFGVDFYYEDYTAFSGATSNEIVHHFLDLSNDEVEELVSKKSAYFMDLAKKNGLETMPFLKLLLDQVKGSYKIAIATGGRRSKVDFMLEKVNLTHYFDEIVTADDLKSGKPDPEIFLKTAEKLKVRPEEALVWEDATLGVQAAKNGNFKCVAITTTQKGKKEGLEKADKIIDSFEGIKIKNIIMELF